MGFKKYVKDYSKEYIIKPNGKPGVTATYMGKYYRFVAEETAIKRAKLLFTCFAALVAVFCIIPLCFNSVGSHTFYVALPHVVTLFPLSYLLIGIWHLWFCEPPLIREFRDKTERRITNASAASALCLGVTGVGEAVNCILVGFPLLDVTYCVSVFVACGAASFVFFSRKVLKTEECTSTGEKIS